MRTVFALLRSVLVACFLVFTAARGAEGSVAGDILSLTGGARTKIVWMRQTPYTIMIFDTNVGSEQVVTQQQSGWPTGHPPSVFLTPAGNRIIFGENSKLYVVDTNGANKRELCAAYAAMGVAEDPVGTEWAYYADNKHDANPRGRLWRVQIDNTSVKQLMWDKTSICWQWSFTRDGKKAAGALPWPGCHIADLPNGSYYQVHDSGCQVSIAPSATRMLHLTALQFGGEHRGISVHVIPGGSDSEINLGAAPGVNNQALLWPNWAMYDDRFFVISGPWTDTSGTMNILLGQFNAAFNGIANWVQVSQAPAGMQDCAPICWIQSGSVPANVTIDTFTATPGAILPGGSSTLSWSTTNATSVSIDQGVGGVAVDGSRTVTPGDTTTYTLTAQGTGGPVTQPVEVRVSQPVLTTIVVSPSSVTILANGSATFSAATLDQFGAPISATVNWSVSSGGGSLSSTTGLSTTFTSSGPEGTFTVTASSGSVQGLATVTVAPPPTITILQPVAGDVWYVGTTRSITWTATGVNNFMVLYSQDGGAYSAISGGTMEYSVSWTVPDSPSTQTEILVRDYFGILATSSVILEIRSVTDSDGDGMDDFWEWDYFGDLSQDGSMDHDGDGYTNLDEFLNATDPSDPDDPPESITITSPMGGESWDAGTQKIISWNASGMANVRIELSRDGGTTWAEIAASTGAAAGAFTWWVTGPASPSCFVRISDAADGVPSVASDADFAIVASPLVVEPNVLDFDALAGALGGVVTRTFTVRYVAQPGREDVNVAVDAGNLPDYLTVDVTGFRLAPAGSGSVTISLDAPGMDKEDSIHEYVVGALVVAASGATSGQDVAGSPAKVDIRTDVYPSHVVTGCVPGPGNGAARPTAALGCLVLALAALARLVVPCRQGY